MTNYEIQNEFKKEVEKWALKTNEIFPNVKLETPSVSFDLKGIRKAGTANTRKNHVSFNWNFIKEHHDEMLNQVVAHEVAHLVADKLQPKAHHGRFWQHVMLKFGKRPETRHSMDLSLDNPEVKKLKRVAYKCSCKTHFVSKIVQNRILSGRTYTCMRCKTRIVKLTED